MNLEYLAASLFFYGLGPGHLQNVSCAFLRDSCTHRGPGLGRPAGKGRQIEIEDSDLWSRFATVSKSKAASRESIRKPVLKFPEPKYLPSGDSVTRGFASKEGQGKTVGRMLIRFHFSHFLQRCLISTNFPKGAKVH